LARQGLDLSALAALLVDSERIITKLRAEGYELFQHASSTVLKAMRRPAHQEKTLERISSWRETCPDLAIRSTFIVGFPGETEEDFVFLLEWLSEARLARVGCFK
jgi:tRNA A37 methylthiotransferase MiaB